MARRQIVAHGGLDPDLVLEIGAKPLLALPERVQEDGTDQILLGIEVGVEGTVGQPGRRHDTGKTSRRDAVLAELRRGHLDDVRPRRVLVSLLVAHPPVPLPTRPAGVSILATSLLNYSPNIVL